MWQKLNRLDIVNLEKARVQIINVLQLVAAPLRSYIGNSKNKLIDWPEWDQESSSFVSHKFGQNEEITVSLDLDKFILSINGAEQKKEHLVLSGMTYPMAYGWMQIKLETFQLDSSLFDDKAPYKLESYLKPEAEISSEDQLTYNQIAINYSNAAFLLNKLKKELSTNGKILIDPSNANMVMFTALDFFPKLGFSLGNKSFPEPYYFLSLKDKSKFEIEDFDGIWNSAQSEFVIMASDFLNQNQDLEYQKVRDFFSTNLAKIPK